MRKLLSLLLAVRCLLVLPAAAQTCPFDFNQVGTVVPGSGTSCYRITSQGVYNSAGALWSPQAVNLNSDFDLSFAVTQCGGADGVVFVLQNDGPTPGFGATGENLGYYRRSGGFTQSVGIELDLYQNNYAPYFDPPYPHMMLALNGSPTPVRGPVALPQLNDCQPHQLRVRWSAAAHLLTVQLDGTTVFTHSQDLIASVFGGRPAVWYGFVGSTGGVTATQTVCLGTQAAAPAPSSIITTTGPAVLCAGDRTVLSAPFYGAGTTYAWSPAAGLNATTNSGVVAAPLATTTYRVRVTTPGGCQFTDSVRISVLPALTATVSGRQVVCAGTAARLQASSPAAGATYAWAPATGLSTTTGPTVVATPAATALYTVTTTAGPCARQDTVRVVVQPAPQLAVAAQRPSSSGGSTLLTATSAVPGTTYAWAPALGLSATTGPQVTASPTEPTTYTVLATTPGGCTEPVSIVAQPFRLPNIITPNGDHLNDTFRPLVSLEPVTLQVFTRWGQLVFEQANYRDGWGADNLAGGTYYYRLTTAQGEAWRGWLDVIR